MELWFIHATIPRAPEKVASLTGLDPHRFDDAVQIRLSLVLRSLESEPADYADAQYLAVKHA